MQSVQPQMANGGEDLAAATLEFENGAIGDLFASWTTYLSPVNPSYMILGSKGSTDSTPASTANDGAPVRHFGLVMYGFKEDVPREERKEQPFEPLNTSDINLPSTSFFVNEILHFEECIREGKEPVSSGHDNIETMKVLFGIFESARTGKAIDLTKL